MNIELAAEVISILQNDLEFATENDLDKIQHFCQSVRDDIDNDDPALAHALKLAGSKGFDEEELKRHILPSLRSWESLLERARDIADRIVTFIAYWLGECLGRHSLSTG